MSVFETESILTEKQNKQTNKKYPCIIFIKQLLRLFSLVNMRPVKVYYDVYFSTFSILEIRFHKLNDVSFETIRISQLLKIQ